MSKIEVNVLNFNNLIKKELIIPDFQRAYVWDKSNFEKLYSDIREYKRNSTQLEYYMGTILLYKNESDEFEIIDGQQRITTLLIIYSLLKELPLNINLNFKSKSSINSIIRAKDYYSSKENIFEDIFEQLKFTVIITKSQDEAFTFFDTQNNRGIKLRTIDLLKAHHLRAIDDISKQTISAKKWEKIELFKKSFINNSDDFVDDLFKFILYRARLWKGSSSSIVKIEKSQRKFNDNLKVEFEKNRKSENIKLYPHLKNMLIHSIDVDDNEDYILDLRFKQYRHTPIDIPFSLRQPISKGLEFFLFVEKYALITSLISTGNIKSKLFNRLYAEIINGKFYSTFLREFFILCIVCFYDKYEEKELDKFSLWLEYLIGSIRVKNDRVVEESIPKFIREDLYFNIIDEILNSYEPQNIIEYIKSIKSIDNIYRDYKIPQKDLNRNTVKKSYINAIEKFYNQENITNKKEWIENFNEL